MQKHKTYPAYYGIIVCAMAGLFYCYEYVLRILPGALQTELMEAFGHISAGTFGQISALYYFAYSPMQWPVGLLMDRYGPRRILTFACLCCALGSWMFAQTSILWLAGAGRFLVGFGSSFAFVGVLFLGHYWLPRRFFSLLVGLVTTFAMFSVMYGVVKITDLTDQVGLPTIQAFLIGMGLFLALLTVLIVRDAPQPHMAIHAQPFRLFLKEVWQVVSSRQIWIIGLIGACTYTALSVFGELWGKVYLQEAHHLTKFEAARAISAVFLGWAVGAPLVGYLSDHTGERVKPLLFSTFGALVTICIILYVPGLSFWVVSLCLFLYGVFTSTEILVFVMGKEATDARLSGTVFATVNMIVMLGGVVLQPSVGYLLDWCASKAGSVGGYYYYTVSDYQIALSVLPLSLVVVIVLLLSCRFSKVKSA